MIIMYIFLFTHFKIHLGLILRLLLINIQLCLKSIVGVEWDTYHGNEWGTYFPIYA